MADAPFGLRAVSGHTGPNCQMECYFPAADGTAAFRGDLVKFYGTHTAAEGGRPAVIVAGDSDPGIVGVVEQFLPDYDSLSAVRYRAASTLRRCLVTLALPNIVFEIQADASLALGTPGSHYDTTGQSSGSTTTGQSAVELAASTGVGTALQLTLLGPSNEVGEDTLDTAAAGSNVRVVIFESVWTGTATGLTI